jgi:leucyl aminopeptidase (aminopeptidase T)
MLKIYGFKGKGRMLTTAEKAAGKNVMRNCLEVKSGEKVLVVTDSKKEKIEAAIFFESAKQFTNKVKMVIMSPTGQHGAEPPSEVTKLMKEADVVLAPTTYSITHTKARANACNAGARIVTMPGITLDTILRTLTIDYKNIASLSKKIAGLLTIAQKAELTSPSGTKMIFSLEGRDGMPDTGLFFNPGDYGNLPAGEAFISPKEGSSQGILVFEACFGDLKLNEPLAFEVKNGLVTKALTTHKDLKVVETSMNKIGPKARNIAELGIGTNQMAKPGQGILEVEKIYGTAHVALGNNAYFGGEVDVPYHMDGLIVYPTLKLDGQTIIKNGKFMI